jgi:hypothetical protein
VIFSFLRRYEFWILLVAGLVWLNAGADGGLLAFVLAAIPGGLMLTAAFGTLNLPGSRGINRVGGLGGLVGVIMAVPLLLVDPLTALGLGVLAAAALVATGLLSLDEFPIPDGLPPVERSIRTGAEVGFDEAVLGLASVLMAPYADGGQAQVARETKTALALFEDQGWLADPHAFHRRPPPLTAGDVRLQGRHGLGWAYEELSFDSGYEPWPDVPGRDRYLRYGACRRAYAWVLRGSPSAPWLVCIHGLGMGRTPLDLNLLYGRLLHRELGINLVFPVLPLHGPRRLGAVSGRGFQTGDFLDTLHAESQAVWDIRRIKSWIRTQAETPIGLHGMSMGGFHTALLAALDDDQACAIAGIPVADQAALVWHHVAPAALNALRDEGLDIETVRSLLQVVSPLRLDPLVAPDRRFIWAGIADRFVPAQDVLLLYEHWQRPRTLWYPGAHLSFPQHEAVGDFIADAVRGTLLEPSDGQPG